MWTAIQKIIPRKIRQLGLGTIIYLFQLQKDWEDLTVKIAGPIFVKKSKPIQLQNKILIVDCLNSVWANEFQMKEQELLREINKKYKNALVEKIRFIS